MNLRHLLYLSFWPCFCLACDWYQLGKEREREIVYGFWKKKIIKWVNERVNWWWVRFQRENMRKKREGKIKKGRQLVAFLAKESLKIYSSIPDLYKIMNWFCLVCPICRQFWIPLYIHGVTYWISYSCLLWTTPRTEILGMSSHEYS